MAPGAGRGVCGGGAGAEGQEAWRIVLSPPVPGIAAWDSAVPMLSIDAGVMAALPTGTALAIRQVGDFDLSRPLVLPLI